MSARAAHATASLPQTHHLPGGGRLVVHHPDILTQTLALHHLFETKATGGQFALVTYAVLTLLIMLVDTIPLMVKFFCKPGPYDTLLDRDEVRYDSDHKAFLESHGRCMAQLAGGNHLAVTPNKSLEDALLDGVEHTRVAREFLNSLIELEKAFHERLLLEQEAAKLAGPEKRADHLRHALVQRAPGRNGPPRPFCRLPCDNRNDPGGMNLSTIGPVAETVTASASKVGWTLC